MFQTSKISMRARDGGERAGRYGERNGRGSLGRHVDTVQDPAIQRQGRINARLAWFSGKMRETSFQ
jgi:hypothetical protein